MLTKQDETKKTSRLSRNDRMAKPITLQQWGDVLRGRTKTNSCTKKIEGILIQTITNGKMKCKIRVKKEIHKRGKSWRKVTRLSLIHI